MILSPLAQELNERISVGSLPAFQSLSGLGKRMYFPKGIITQGNEAKEKAHRFNATLGVGWHDGKPMMLDEVMTFFNGLEPEEVLPYAPTEGRKKLRNIWKDQLYAKNPSLKGKEISLPAVTNGITHSLSLAADLFCDEGDPLILPTPFWGNYRLLFETAKQARVETFPLFDEKAEKLNPEGLEDALNRALENKDKALILLNFPNNPTGYTPYQREFDRVREILLAKAETGKRLVVLHDDAYFGLNFDDCAAESLFAQLHGLHPGIVNVKLDGCTKEKYVWGFRCGFITFGVHCRNPAPVYEALQKKISGLIRAKNSNLNHAAQTIMEKVFAAGGAASSQARNFERMRGRARKIEELLKRPEFAEHFSAFPFNSGYFMCIRLRVVSSEALRLRLLEKHGIGLISIGEDIVRVAFCAVNEENLEELFNAILQACRELAG